MTVFWNYITETEIKQISNRYRIQMLLSDGSEYRIGYRLLADKSSRKLPCRKTSSTTFPVGQFLCCAVGIYQYIFRKSRGVVPVTLRNMAIKWLASENPEAPATSWIFISGLESRSSRARLMRYMVTYS